jgi:hypothetical protein
MSVNVASKPAGNLTIAVTMQSVGVRFLSAKGNNNLYKKTTVWGIAIARGAGGGISFRHGRRHRRLWQADRAAKLAILRRKKTPQSFRSAGFFSYN